MPESEPFEDTDCVDATVGWAGRIEHHRQADSLRTERLWTLPDVVELPWYPFAMEPPD